LGGGVKGKPHSTREGRDAAGRRVFEKITGRSSKWRKPRGLGRPKRKGAPARSAREDKAEGGRIGFKEGGNGKWIQKATKGMVKTKPCTGRKFGSKSCPPGSRRYNLAKTFKKMGRERKAEA